MKKIIILFCLITLFSCSSDDSNAPSTTTEKLSTTTTSNDVTTFDYSGEKLLSISENEIGVGMYKSELIYDGDKVSRIKYYVDGVYVSGGDLVFTYSGDNITMSTSTEDGIVFTNEFEYNGSGQMTSDSQFNDGVLENTTSYTYDSNGNVSSYSTTDGFSVDNITYDNKKNPEYYAFPAALARITPLTKNNVLNFGATSYTYEYNENGYPTSQTGGSGGAVQYTYE